jgi:hypothetical protein
MKKSAKNSSALLLVLFSFVTCLSAQTSFKDKIVPLLDSVNSPYKAQSEFEYLVTYCGTDVDCAKVYVQFGRLYENESSCYLNCYTILFSDYENPIPPMSLVKKASELNNSLNYGKVAIFTSEKSYVVYYQNDVWFDNVTASSLSKNIQMCYIKSGEFRKEFAVFKE